MKVGQAIAEILKREGVEIVFGYPVNHVLEAAAVAGIRPVIVRQERVGLHMADAMARVSSGRKVGVFAMQHGPGAENSFGGVAQAYSESIPILVMPMGYARRLAYVDPNFNSVASMRTVTKSAEAIMSAAEVPNILRRAFSRLRNGRGGPALVEIPVDLFTEEFPGPLSLRARHCDTLWAGYRRGAACRSRAARRENSGDLCGAGSSLGAGVGAAAQAGGIAAALRFARVSQGKARFRKTIRWRWGRAGWRFLPRFRIFWRRRIGFSAWAAVSRKRRLGLRCRRGRSSFTPRSIRII